MTAPASPVTALQHALADVMKVVAPVYNAGEVPMQADGVHPVNPPYYVFDGTTESRLGASYHRQPGHADQHTVRCWDVDKDAAMALYAELVLRLNPGALTIAGHRVASCLVEYLNDLPDPSVPDMWRPHQVVARVTVRSLVL